MSRYEDIRNRLPSLYRPDDDDTGLLNQLIKAVGESLEHVNSDATHVLHSHWFKTSDRALFNEYFQKCCQVSETKIPKASDPILLDFPYIRDLSRLGGLLGLPPLKGTMVTREKVEEYRKRIEKIVGLYKNGLGTLNAIRQMTEAHLLVETSSERPHELPFTIEEYPYIGKPKLTQAKGIFTDLVGPLMRWSIAHEGLDKVSPTVYIQGSFPAPGDVDSTENPMIELYSSNGQMCRISVGYKGTIAFGKTLRLQPAHMSWVSTDNGIAGCSSVGETGEIGDPTAPGPWQEVSDCPTEQITCLYRTDDNFLWVGTSSGILGRYNGTMWESVLSDHGVVKGLIQNEHTLLIGTENGLYRMPLYPGEHEDAVAEPVVDLAHQCVNAIFRDKNGTYWVGTDVGLFKLSFEDGCSAMPHVLCEGTDTETGVYCIAQDESQNLFFGTELGLFQLQAGTGHWYWYQGKERSDSARDWQPYVDTDPDSFPSDEDVYLPAVFSIHRGPDTSLWLGTQHGIVRYKARQVRSLTYDTVLEAYPELTSKRVFSIKEDVRGCLWFCTEEGIFKFDGRDWWQYQQTEFAPIRFTKGLSDTEKMPERVYRFSRNTSKWGRYDYDTATWDESPVDTLGIIESAAYDVLWTDHVLGDLGTFDGQNYTKETPIPLESLFIRVKPSARTIANGGLPFIPKQPVGTAVWRYLSLEPSDMQTPSDLPSWSKEGRLFNNEELPAPYPGRFNNDEPPDHPESHFDDVVFAFNPAARVWFEIQSRQLLSVMIRLNKSDTPYDPTIIQRVWNGIEQVRPAGVRAQLAVGEDIVGGNHNG